MLSANVRPDVISAFIASELVAGRVLGPVEPLWLRWYRSTGLVWSKGHQPGKQRLIVDLSFLRGNSVDDGIEPGICSLRYTSVDEACKHVVARGRGTVLAKFDVEGVSTLFLFIPMIDNV